MTSLKKKLATWMVGDWEEAAYMGLDVGTKFADHQFRILGLPDHLTRSKSILKVQPKEVQEQ